MSVSPSRRFFDGIEDQPDRLVVGEGRARKPQDLAHRRGEDLLVVGLPVHEARDAARKLPVELLAERAAGRRPGARLRLEERVLGRLFQRDRVLEHGPVERVVAQDLLDHLPDDLALLRRRVEGLAEPPVTEERDAGDRVVQVGEGRDRQHVARDLLRALLHGARELRARPSPRVRPGKDAEIPLAGERGQELGQPLVGRLLGERRLLEEVPLRGPHRRHGVVARP